MCIWRIETVLARRVPSDLPSDRQRRQRIATICASACIVYLDLQKYGPNDDTVFRVRQRKQMRHAYYRNKARQIPPIQDQLFHRIFPVVISLVFTTEPDYGFSGEARHGTNLVATLQRLSKTRVYAACRPKLASIPG
jgi:hypothetical protein